ncbi:MAG: ROK family protein [Spirochaetia bacterium]|jgi:predicted NBD/HSP70 family sugar kinase
MIKRGNLQSELNQYQVIRLLRNRGHVTRPELVRETGLSRPTIDKIVELYKGERIIRETGTVDGSSRGGRRPVVLSLDGSTKVLIGIDFECPRLEMVMTDLGSTIIDCRVRNYGPGSQSEKIVDRLIVDIREMLRRNGRTTDELLGIGVALPGVVDVRSGISLNIERLRNWNNVPLSRLIGSSIGVPVFIDNDVNLMALAEKNLGPAEIPNNLIYVAQRQGIGAGILIDGQIFRGNLGNAGFLGHTSINPQGAKCKCGNQGCLELYAGEHAVAEQFRRKRKHGPASDPVPSEHISAHDVYEAAARQDPAAIGVLYDAGGILGIGIANMICLFDINHVILGGDSAKAGESFCRGVKDSINRRLEPAFRTNMELRFSTVNEHAAALGATLLVQEDVFGAPELAAHL